MINSKLKNKRIKKFKSKVSKKNVKKMKGGMTTEEAQSELARIKSDFTSGNYRKILGIEEGIELESSLILRKFNRLILQYHPDSTKRKKETEEVAKILRECFELMVKTKNILDTLARTDEQIASNAARERENKKRRNEEIQKAQAEMAAAKAAREAKRLAAEERERERIAKAKAPSPPRATASSPRPSPRATASQTDKIIRLSTTYISEMIETFNKKRSDIEQQNKNNLGEYNLKDNFFQLSMKHKSLKLFLKILHETAAIFINEKMNKSKSESFSPVDKKYINKILEDKFEEYYLSVEHELQDIHKELLKLGK
jgi:hypothetical protein